MPLAFTISTHSAATHHAIKINSEIPIITANPVIHQLHTVSRVIPQITIAPRAKQEAQIIGNLWEDNVLAQPDTSILLVVAFCAKPISLIVQNAHLWRPAKFASLLFNRLEEFASVLPTSLKQLATVVTLWAA